MHFLSLLFWFHCRVCYYLKCSSSPSLSGQRKGQKIFLDKNLFQLTYNHKPKSNAPLRKSHKTADRKGQPDRKISASFFDDFPKHKEISGTHPCNVDTKPFPQIHFLDKFTSLNNHKEIFRTHPCNVDTKPLSANPLFQHILYWIYIHVM